MKNTIDTALVTTGVTSPLWMSLLHEGISCALGVLSIMVMFLRVMSLWKDLKYKKSLPRDRRGRFIKRVK